MPSRRPFDLAPHRQLPAGNLGITSSWAVRQGATLVEESAPEPNPTTKAIRHVQLGIVLRELGRRAEALVAFNEAVDALRRLNNNERLFPILMDRALLLQQFGRTDEAIVDARAALDVVEKIRARLAPSDFLKQGFNQRNQSIYELAIGLLTQAKRHDEALEAAEQGRARAFVDLLASRSRQASDSQQTTDDARRAASLADIRQEAVRLGAPVIAYWVGEKTTWIWAVATDATAASSPLGPRNSTHWSTPWAADRPGAFQPRRGDARGTRRLSAPAGPPACCINTCSRRWRPRSRTVTMRCHPHPARSTCACRSRPR
jgi:hypothetical protein